MTDTAGALVTGAAGFIGRHLVRRLAAEDRDVTAVDVSVPPDESLPDGVRWERCDVRDTGRLERMLPAGGDVFHLASVHLEVGEDESAFEEVNIRAAAALVDACRRSGVRRLIHTSSVGIYGHVQDPPAVEESPKNPETPYERTKLAGERAVRQRAEETGADVVILRPAWVYGPGCPRTEKLVDALRHRRFFYIGDGSNLRHPLYIEDMLDAFLLAAGASGSASGQAYLIGGPRSMPLREMVETFARVLEVPAPQVRIPRPVGWTAGLVLEGLYGLAGREPPLSRRSLAFFENDNAFDIDVARRDLGFAPAVDLEEGIRRTLRSVPAEAAA